MCAMRDEAAPAASAGPRAESANCSARHSTHMSCSSSTRARHFELALLWSARSRRSDAAPKMGGPLRAERAQSSSRSTTRVAHRVMKDREVRRALSKTNASPRLSYSRGNGALDSN